MFIIFHFKKELIAKNVKILLFLLEFVPVLWWSSCLIPPKVHHLSRNDVVCGGARNLYTLLIR